MRNWNDLRLWDEQKAALAVCGSYLNQPEQSCLVQMPTGAGKTGIIAVLAAARCASGISLILAPSEALVHQLIEDIRKSFWDVIRAPQSWPPKRVEQLLLSRDKKLRELFGDANKSRVLVGTYQALQQINADDPTLYGELRNSVGTVLVDEGHREPAESWARAVRGLAKPTVLFSATPYRNDERLFEVSSKHTHFLSFKKAVEENYIRDVKFDDLPSVDETPENFVASVVAKVGELTHRGEIAADAKVIIRAAEYDTVEALYQAFLGMSSIDPLSVIAFHERYVGSTSGRLSRVPPLRGRSEKYLLHQYKLLEGIDEPRAGILALYEDFTSARQLVQQVGRIIRNPRATKKATEDAFVLLPPWSDARDVWNSYKEYDRYCAENPGTSLTRQRSVVEAMVSKMPEIGYMGQGFRRRVSFDDPGLFTEIRLPRSCVVFGPDPAFTMAAFGATLKKSLESEDRLVVKQKYDPQHRSWLLLSVAAQPSELLANSYFPQLSLHVTAATLAGGKLFLTDTGGIWFDEIDGVGRRIAVDNLRTLFPDHDDTRLSRVTARNSDVGPAALRSRTLTARSLAGAAPFMGDSLHVLAQAQGSVPTVGRRYVGFTRGRVRDADGASCNLSDYWSWIQALNAELATTAQPAPYFERFLATSRPPANTAPVNVLVDLEAFADEFARQNAPLVAEDLCADVTVRPHPTNKLFSLGFDITLIEPGGRRSVAMWIRYDRDRERYEILCDELSKFTNRSKRKSTATARINQEQAIRVIPRDSGYFYAGGDFYRIDAQSGLRTMRRAVLSLLNDLPGLLAIGDEKGTGPGNGADWSAGSLFAFIDQGLKGPVGVSPFKCDFASIVCDDSQREVADFIAFNEGQNASVAFVHAKAHEDPPGTGAGKLYDVCSQASKNLAYIRFGANEVASSIEAWNRPWDLAGYLVAPRIRRGATPAAQFRDRLKALVDIPNIKRDVWIVLGRILSKARLSQDLGQQRPPPHAVQTAYLLMSLDNACKSVGVELKVFCSP